MRIKPHHFLDIIKLHGAGYDTFIPDLNMGHDFYKIGNEVLNNPNLQLQLCVNGDDICQPCHFFKENICQDGKENYNQRLDRRMLEKFELSLDKEYTALELCQLLYIKRDLIPDCWKEEEHYKLKHRIDYFSKGAEKYILKYGKTFNHNADFRSGLMSAFCEVVGAGVKKLAFSAATNDITQFASDIASALFFSSQYQVHFYLEQHLIETILFKDAPSKVFIFYKNQEEIEAYLHLKELPQNTIEERIDVARALGKLLSYDENHLDEMIEKSLTAKND